MSRLATKVAFSKPGKLLCCQGAGSSDAGEKHPLTLSDLPGHSSGSPVSNEDAANQTQPFPKQFRPHTACSSASCEVFISHPGTVKRGIVAWLHQSLWASGVRSFLDEKDLEHTCDADSTMEVEACSAQIVICVLTPDFFTRKWTLQELHWALRSRETNEAKVYPVFYGISPDDKAEMVHKMEAWLQSKGIDPSSCFKDVASLFRITGLRSEAKDGFEPAMVEEVVRKVLAELQRTPLYLPLDLVGMEKRVQDTLDYLQANDGSQAVKVLGLYGLGGSGKSTLAKALYNHLYIDFPGRHAFIEVGQDSSPSYLSGLQATLLSTIFNRGRDVTIPSVARGQQSLCDSTTTGGKVLIALDNIWDRNQRKALFPDALRLPPGSIVIMTSRDQSLLAHSAHQEVKRQPAQLLADGDDEKMLCLHAFGQPAPPERQAHLVKPVVDACHGLPLVLEVVGAYLRQKEDSTWAEITEQLRSLGDLGTDDAILQSLMLSYNRLKPGQQTVFLDVAVMLLGADKKSAGWILQGTRGRNAGSAHIDLEALIDLSLVECDASGSLRIHDTISDMARYIISKPDTSPVYLELDDHADIQQSTRAPKIISRLRYSGQELPEKLLEATHEMEGLVLVDLKAYKWAQESVSAQEAPSGFQHLAYLRVSGAERFPDAFVDPAFGLPALVALDLAHLGGPGGAADIPNLTRSGKLKVLRLRNCKIKGEYLSALGSMSQLRQVVVQRDLDLSRLPSSIGQLADLEVLDLSGCRKLAKLPDDLCQLTKLQELCLQSCESLEELPEHLGSLGSLRVLNLRKCGNLGKLPDSVKDLSNLEELGVQSCAKLEGLPDGISGLSSLQRLYLLFCESLKGLPKGIGQLSNLQVLSLRACTALSTLPDEIGGARSLRSLDLQGCTALTRLPGGFTSLSGLRELDLSGCTGLQRLPRKFDRLVNLEQLSLQGSTGLRSLPVSFGSLDKLKILDLSGCSELKKLSDSFGSLQSLQKLMMRDCTSLEMLPDFGRMQSLQDLDLSGCSALQRLPANFNRTRNVRLLNLDGCKSLIWQQWEVAGIAIVILPDSKHALPGGNQAGQADVRTLLDHLRHNIGRVHVQHVRQILEALEGLVVHQEGAKYAVREAAGVQILFGILQTAGDEVAEEAAATLLEHMSWDAERDMPDEDVAIELCRLGAVQILLRMHDHRAPGAAWACLANIIGVESAYKAAGGPTFGAEVLQLLRGSTTSKAKISTARCLANLPENAYWVLDPHFDEIRREVAARLFSGIDSLSTDERQFLERALENMSST